MTNSSSIQNLKDLKKSYDDDLVSALVGAGFSKNVYKSYPSWPELLEDIVKVLYPTEYKKTECKRQKIKDKAKSLNELVNRLGPLNIVSKYIEYRGLGHEAIDIYIESKIPTIKISGKNIEIDGHTINRESLSAHEALLNCNKIRNIYTTNYDNILEVAREYLEIPYFKSTIKNAQSLSDSLSKQSIIKVHGDLRKPGDELYEFDKDKNVLYIISKEDYENYQKKHEAFSFMMRLAMLQGKFCLVGFSGNDPNFQFWLHWMKDIIDKGQQSDDTKVFLIDFIKEELADDVKLFYKNHRIGVINLLDSLVQSELFPDSSPNVEDKSISETRNEKDWRELLTGLFKYLKGKPIIAPQKEQGIYYSLWSEASQLTTDNQDVSTVVERLLEVRESLGPQKSVEYQNVIINKLRKKKNWTESDTTLFSIALADMGLYPTMFSDEMENKNPCCSNNLIWKELQERGNTLKGVESLLNGSDDKTYFENALRLLFGFRFTELKELLGKWTPTGDYIYKISLLLSFFDSDRAKQLIEGYINSNSNHVQKRLLASQIANLVYEEIPYHYLLDQYFDQGLSSFSDIIIHINRNIGEYEPKILPYSVNERTVHFGSCNRPFRESSRILSYLINWGYTTFYKYVTCISTDVWMQVFIELFESYPNILLYYSSLYSDEKLLKRIGQEYAYSRSLHKDKIQKKLLQYAFRGLSDENTPWYNRRGLLMITGEIYISVDEELWYEDFKKIVFIPYVTSINENTEIRDVAFHNIAKAFYSIRQKEHVEECFKELMSVIDRNPRLISEIINDYFPVKNLKGGDYEKVLRVLVKERNLSEVYPILYIMNHYKLLSNTFLQVIDEKAASEGLDFAKRNKNALIQLSYILSNEVNLATIKKMVLENDVWNCGISNGTITSPTPIKIERLSNKVVWNDNEKSILLKNLEKNLTLISSRDRYPTLEPLLFYKNAELLLSMILFFSTNYEKGNYKDIENRIKSVFEKECEISHNLKGLAADEEDRVFVSIEIVNIVLSYYPITKVFHEISVILNRALQKNKVALSLVLSEINVLVEKFEDDMWDMYRDVLLQILRDYREINYRELNLNLSHAYEYLNKIAQSAKKQGVNDECVDYWLTDDEVLRFNNINA